MPYHIRIRQSQIGDTAIIVGDRARVQVVASKLKNPVQIGSNREYLTFTGNFGNKKITVMSTGIGGPAAAIAIEELAQLGVKTIIRVGTCGSLDRLINIGDVVVAEAALRMDGTTRQYVQEGYPAAASPDVIIALCKAASALGVRYRSGLSASSDAFYVGEGKKSFAKYTPEYSRRLSRDMHNANILCIEMETSTLFTLGRLFGIRTGAALAVIDNYLTNKLVPDAGIEDAIKVALEAIKGL